MQNALHIENQTNTHALVAWLDAFWRHWINRYTALILLVSIVVLVGLESRVASADQGSSQSYYVKLDREIQALKQEFLELNRDLSLLEEEVLYPPDQQLVVFFSISSGTLFTPSAVNVQLDGEVLVHHEYAPSEVEALRRGGVHRLYIGRVQTGDHALEISLAGTQGAGGDFTRKTSTEFSRWRGPTYVELRVEGTGNKEEPEFRVDFW